MELLVCDGSPLKMVSDGTNGPLVMEGHLVVFSGDEDPDLSGEYFTAKTDFGALSDLGETTVAAYYHHGLDPEIGRERIGTARLKIDEVGVWAEYQITKRKEYLRRIAQHEQKTGEVVLGQSSGALPHTVNRERTGKSVWLKSWDIGEASPTPEPCEPRTSAAIKTHRVTIAPEAKMLDFSEGVGAARDRAQTAARAALPGAEWVWVEEMYPAAIVVSMDDAPEAYRIPVTDDGATVTLAPRSEWVEVERVIRFEEATKTAQETADMLRAHEARTLAASITKTLTDCGHGAA